MSQLINKIGQIKKLKNGVGIQYLLDEVYKIIENPIIMFDTEYKYIAHNDVVTDDLHRNELITSGTFSENTIRLFEKDGFIEDMANAAKITFMKSENLKYDRIAGKIFNKNNTYVANLIVMAYNRPFQEHDSILFEAVCKLITKEISKIDFYQEYEQSHQEVIIKSLIDENYDIGLDKAQVGIIYDALESNLYIAVVDIMQHNLLKNSCAFYRDLLKKAQPKFKYAIYENYILIIISTNDEVLDVNLKLKELISIFEQYNMYAGISGKFENLFELKKYYQQALEAMNYTLCCKCAQRIYPCHPESIDLMEQIKALENGCGIQYFLDIAPKIFINPVLFHDMELNLLAYSKNIEIIDPIWQELIKYGTSSYETIELFRTVGFVETMDITKAGAILVSDKIKYDRISWRIYNSEAVRIGCTSIVNTIKPFSDDELVLFGVFSQKFSKEVGQIDFYNNYGQVYSETIINRLISGKIDDSTFYSEDAGNLYDDNFKDNLFLIVVDMSKCKKQINLTYLKELFNWKNTTCRYAFYKDYIVIIISIEITVLNEKVEFAQVCKIFEQNNIYAGVSSCFGNIYELQNYYTEAVDALNSCISENNGKY